MNRLVILLALSALCAASMAAGESPDDELLRLGQRLYEEGLGVDGQPVIAVLETPGGSPRGSVDRRPRSPGVELPATALPCGSCHGSDGRGRSEGGVHPTDLSWSRLTRPWAATTATGRSHPPYDEKSLIQAITLGFDPAGQRLEIVMPRYRLSLQDADALVSYLRHLGKKETVSGVDHDRLFVGVVRPWRLDRPQEAALASLEAWESELAQQGVYGRRIELRDIGEDQVPGDVIALIVLPGARFRAAESSAADSPGADSSGARGPVAIPSLHLGLESASCPTCFKAPAEASTSRSRRWRHLSSRRALPSHDLQAQKRALWAAETLTAALEASGRRAGSEALLASLRGLAAGEVSRDR